MINVWDYQEVVGKVKVTCTDGQILTGNMGDVTDVEDETDLGFTEDSITLYVKGVPIGIPQSEIKSIEILE